MARIKLSEYCRRNGISYMTGYRWFKENKMPVPCIQIGGEDGGIFVEDNSEEKMQNNNINELTYLIKDAVFFIDKKSSIEEFVSYIILNYDLKKKSRVENGVDYLTKDLKENKIPLEKSDVIEDYINIAAPPSISAEAKKILDEKKEKIKEKINTKSDVSRNILSLKASNEKHQIKKDKGLLLELEDFFTKR